LDELDVGGPDPDALAGQVDLLTWPVGVWKIGPRKVSRPSNMSFIGAESMPPPRRFSRSVT
jgi:hypothetical protein